MMYSSDLAPSLTGISIDPHRASRDAFRGVDFRGYLQDTMAVFHQALPGLSELVSPADLPERVFQVLTSREYCYLSSARVAPYKEDALRWITQAVAEERPIPFYFDIGGGYHATLEPGVDKLNFDVGLAELLILRQIRSFQSKIAQFYAPGATFTLVVDNMCAALINDIALEKTTEYCRKLRALIAETDMSASVDLLVESEHFSVFDFKRERGCAAAPADGALDPKQHANVERFIGRRCDGAEAAERTRLYTEVTGASERLLKPLIQGVHMTQRASATTLCFRPFPGGDSRIQAGEVALLADAKKIRPILLTSRNVDQYVHSRESRFLFLPPSIRTLTFAKLYLG
jgi:hypothetical protein